MDPLAGTPWSTPETVAGFTASAPNASLLAFAQGERPGWALDIGCGAARNALPLALNGWRVLGLDLSWPMLEAAARRARAASAGTPLHLALAPMERLPVRDRSVDLVIAHGIWNLAASGRQFRAAVDEAARVAAPGAGLFVFTFSRHTLPDQARPLPGETFVFTDFSGHPQCFLEREALLAELERSGFRPDPAVPLHELNRPPAGSLLAGSGPVIWEGTFRRVG